MSRDPFFSLAATALLAIGLVFPGRAGAQWAADAQLGRWAINDADDATLYSVALQRKAWGPIGYGLRAFGLIQGGPDDRSLRGFGGELTLLRGRRGGVRLAPYAAGGLSLALRSSDSDLVALWSAGLGLELRAPALFSATLEARRAVEDSGFGGFWNLAEGDRRGWWLALGFSLRLGGADPRGPTSEPVDLGIRPAAGTLDPSTLVGLRREVVESALGAMGEPYRWGGTSTEEGFDCSGLVWYAYASHGVTIPRVSRDQARVGSAVPPSIAALEPGDVLLFSDRPGAVTHVGLYIGEARFIHATTSGGVRVGALDAPGDGSDRWYLSRWTGARRILE